MAAIIGREKSEGAEKPASWDGERPASGRRAAAKSGKTARFGSQNKLRGNKNISAKSRRNREKPPLTFSRCRESEQFVEHHKRIREREVKALAEEEGEVKLI